MTFVGGGTACSKRRAFSMVELLVALVILQVGLLGVAGIVVAATRQLGRAAMLESAISLAEPVADSLLVAGSAASGGRDVPPLRVRWFESGTSLSVEVVEIRTGRMILRVFLPGGEP